MTHKSPPFTIEFHHIPSLTPYCYCYCYCCCCFCFLSTSSICFMLGFISTLTAKPHSHPKHCHKLRTHKAQIKHHSHYTTIQKHRKKKSYNGTCLTLHTSFITLFDKSELHYLSNTYLATTPTHSLTPSLSLSLSLSPLLIPKMLVVSSFHPYSQFLSQQ